MSRAAVLYLIVMAVFIIGLLARSWRFRAARRRHAEMVEEMAKRADEMHEGAKTRHEGGA
jgi:hypothetical protein